MPRCPSPMRNGDRIINAKDIAPTSIRDKDNPMLSTHQKPREVEDSTLIRSVTSLVTSARLGGSHYSVPIIDLSAPLSSFDAASHARLIASAESLHSRTRPARSRPVDSTSCQPAIRCSSSIPPPRLFIARKHVQPSRRRNALNRTRRTRILLRCRAPALRCWEKRPSGVFQPPVTTLGLQFSSSFSSRFYLH